MSERSAEKPLCNAVQASLRALDGRARSAALLGALSLVGASAAAAASAAAFAFAASASAGAGRLLAIAGLLAIGAQALEVIKWRCHARAELRLEQELARSLFESALGRGAPAGVGAEIQALNHAIAGCRIIFQHLIFTAPTALMAALSSAVLIAGLGHPAIGAVMLAFAPAYLAAALWRKEQLMRLVWGSAEARIESARRFGDGLNNREAVRAFQAGDFLVRELDRSLRRVSRWGWKLAQLRTMASGACVAVFALAQAGAWSLVWLSAGPGDQRTTLLVLTSLSLAWLMRPLDMAAQAVRDLVLARALVASIAETALQRVVPALSETQAAEIRFENVSVSLGARASILRCANFHCAPGQTTGICGASGAGKSTIIRLLTGEVRPTDGAVLVDGAPAPGGRLVSVALQETLLLDDTIRANIAFGRAADAHEIERAIAITGLAPLLARLPKGLDTRAGERGARLSGGERQRVALARAMLKPAALYLLDEATSALDPDSEREVMRRVVANRGGATLIVVAHRRTAFAGMDRVVEVAGGRFIPAAPASDANADTGPPFRATNLQNPEAKI
jgi:ABC-type multidrug transport system fused ATPase/permease subunit